MSSESENQDDPQWFRIWSPDSPYTGGTPAAGSKFYEAYMSQSAATDLTKMLRLMTGHSWFNNPGEPDPEYQPRLGTDLMEGVDGMWLNKDGSWQDRNA